MAKGGQFDLNRGDVRKILQGDAVAAVVSEAAEQIADGVRDIVDDDMEVQVYPYVLDRAGANVVIAHPGGLGMQAKRGAFTRAAARLGLQVKKR
ncbi:hypothetical protein GYA93_15810 [Gordonia desulfuricans]|uniref:Uncharacterized protein n=1 Tax=Gordonia desulfuricans TaxID=89051 RepID=A0A7K3LS16_9ACTN|nr:hypothetical protein [Gordonia desulfuricans]NDK91038.1 hypothetical protein [Gordonia desulfuricans]